MTFGKNAKDLSVFSRRDIVAVTTILVFSLVIYLCFLTKNYYWDGISFAQTIEDAGAFQPSLVHPNHLIYNVVGYSIYKAVLSLGINVRAIFVLQGANAFFSATAGAVLFFILRRALQSVSLAVVLTLLFSFSATWWKYSIDADSYIPSVLFMLISFALILPTQRPTPIALALIHSVSMCFHQLAIFFFPVALLGLYFQTSSLSTRRRLFVVSTYAVLAFAITFGAYCVAYGTVRSEWSPGGFFSWITNFSPDVGFVFNVRDSVSHTLRGEVKLFFEGRFNFLYEIISVPIVLLLIIVSAALIGLIYQIYGLLRNRVAGDGPSHRQLLWLCLLWVGVYLSFLFFWLPHNTFYRLFYFPAIIILLGICMKRYQLMERRPWLAPLFVTVVAISNFVFFVCPYSRIRKETPLSVATQLIDIWTPETVIYFQKMNSDDMLIRYFNPKTSWKQVENFDLDALEAELKRDQGDGREVWIDALTFDLINRSPGGNEWRNKYVVMDSRVRVNDLTYNVLFVRLRV